jgi:hypothetical protein
MRTVSHDGIEQDERRRFSMSAQTKIADATDAAIDRACVMLAFFPMVPRSSSRGGP